MNEQQNILKERYFKKQINKLNKQAYEFYLTKRNELSDSQINQEIWNTQIWRDAKAIHREINQYENGTLTCELCRKSINPYVRFFKIQHINSLINWKNLFSPLEIVLVHKECHKDLFNKEIKT